MKSEGMERHADAVGTGSSTDGVASSASTIQTQKRSTASHVTYRSGDTVYCKRCGRSWDVSDTDVPECESKARRDYLKFIEARKHD